MTSRRPPESSDPRISALAPDAYREGQNGAILQKMGEDRNAKRRSETVQNLFEVAKKGYLTSLKSLATQSETNLAALCVYMDRWLFDERNAGQNETAEYQNVRQSLDTARLWWQEKTGGAVTWDQEGRIVLKP